MLLQIVPVSTSVDSYSTLCLLFCLLRDYTDDHRIFRCTHRCNCAEARELPVLLGGEPVGSTDALWFLPVGAFPFSSSVFYLPA